MELVDKWEWYDNAGRRTALNFRGRALEVIMGRRSSSPSPEAQETLRALRRAAKRALQLGIQTGTPVYVIRDNKIIDLTKTTSASKKRSSQTIFITCTRLDLNVGTSASTTSESFG